MEDGDHRNLWLIYLNHKLTLCTILSDKAHTGNSHLVVKEVLFKLWSTRVQQYSSLPTAILTYFVSQYRLNKIWSNMLVFVFENSVFEFCFRLNQCVYLFCCNIGLLFWVITPKRFNHNTVQLWQCISNVQ